MIEIQNLFHVEELHSTFFFLISPVAFFVCADFCLFVLMAIQGIEPRTSCIRSMCFASELFPSPQLMVLSRLICKH